MTKSEQREVSRLDLYLAHGMTDTAARAAAQAQIDALIERIGSNKFNATLAGAAK